MDRHHKHCTAAGIRDRRPGLAQYRAREARGKPAACAAAMAKAAAAHKLYRTDCGSRIAAGTRRCAAAQEMQAAAYGRLLPKELEKSVTAMLAERSAIGGASDV